MSKELEALKSIKGTVISSRVGDWGMEYRYVSDIESTKKHFDIIEEALKRNEPMKLVFDYNDERGYFYYCPNCGKLHLKDFCHYCHHCGQKIDRGDEK